MKKYIVVINEEIRRTKTYEVEAESKDDALERIDGDELEPTREYEKQIDRDSYVYEKDKP